MNGWGLSALPLVHHALDASDAQCLRVGDETVCPGKFDIDLHEPDRPGGRRARETQGKARRIIFNFADIEIGNEHAFRVPQLRGDPSASRFWQVSAKDAPRLRTKSAISLPRFHNVMKINAGLLSAYLNRVGMISIKAQTVTVITIAAYRLRTYLVSIIVLRDGTHRLASVTFIIDIMITKFVSMTWHFLNRQSVPERISTMHVIALDIRRRRTRPIARALADRIVTSTDHDLIPQVRRAVRPIADDPSQRDSIFSPYQMMIAPRGSASR